MSTILQMRKRGTLTLPKKIREKYTLEEGDPLTLIDIGEGILISPKVTTLPKLVSKLEELMEKKGVGLEELIQGIAEEREKFTPR
ncbi:MAG: AbrB/MazE/SpoVT family DNA-binding domain-containing protein [Candidatus Marinimicrobia bacterium]|nr:AbrB/MazE/SpoVT family DNA-binding domain-containing protein [Candidatus Neomarinimicrobiota bacterium]